MSNEIINPDQTFYDDSGIPLANGTISFLVNTKTALGTIFSDEALLVEQANPYTLDASGSIAGDVKYTGLRTLLMKTNLGATVRTRDNVSTVTNITADNAALTTRLNPVTLAIAVADKTLKNKDVLHIKERISGKGGGGIWDVVLDNTVTTDTYGLVVSTGVTTLALVLRIINGIVNAKAIGFDPTVGVDNTAVLVGMSFTDVAEILFGFDTFEFTALNMLGNQTLLSGVAGRTTFKVHSSVSVSDWIKFGSTSAITVGGGIRDIKLEGDSKARNGILLKNTSAITLAGLDITGFDVGMKGQGALAFNVDDIKISNYNTGIQLRKSDSGDTVTIYPNHIQFMGHTHITGGSGKAVDYDEGIGLFFEKLQLDFCGTTTVLTTGGLFVGANIGTEVSSSLYPAIRVEEAIFESIKGRPIEVLSGSVVIDTFSGFDNEDKYVFDTSSAVLLINMVDASANGKIEVKASNNKLVCINTVMTSGIKAVGGGTLNERSLLLNSGTGAEAQDGFKNLSLVDAYIGPTPADKLSDALLTMGGRIGFRRIATDPASGADSIGYQYVKTNNFGGQDGYRQRSRSHAWHTHENTFQMGLNANGDLTATSYTPFTGVHYFLSDVKIKTGLAVDLIDATERNVVMKVTKEIVTEVITKEEVEERVKSKDNEKGKYHLKKVMKDVMVEVFSYQDVDEIQPYRAGGKVAISVNESKVCAGIVKSCEPIVNGYLVSVAAVGDNRAGELKGFKITSCKAGDILCTSTGGKLKVAPIKIAREVVTFKAMSDSVDGIAYGYF